MAAIMRDSAGKRSSKSTVAVVCAVLLITGWIGWRCTSGPAPDDDFPETSQKVSQPVSKPLPIKPVSKSPSKPASPPPSQPLPKVSPETPLLCSSTQPVPVAESAMIALVKDRQWLPNYVQTRVAVTGGKALEIGGTSSLLKPVYNHLATLDNVLYSATTMWEGSVKEGEGTFTWLQGKPNGRQYVLDATNLSSVASDAYDWVLTCHNVEHVANPFKALMEFRRVLRVGGTLVLLLPQKSQTFDRNRADTSLAHMVEDYNTGTAEDDLTHLPEVVEKMSYQHDGGLLAQAKERKLAPPEWLRQRSLKNFESRGLHHHVFGRKTVQQMLQCIGFKVVGARYDGVITDMYLAEKSD